MCTAGSFARGAAGFTMNRFGPVSTNRGSRRKRSGGAALLLLLLLPALLSACRSPARQLEQADRAALQIVEEKQREGLGRTEPFSIVTPEDALRRRLLLGQNLPYAAPASQGSAYLERIEHWPKDGGYLQGRQKAAVPPWSGEEPLPLTLLGALQVGARGSREYQTAKEAVFRAALALDLERDAFRNSFAGLLESELSSERRLDRRISGVENSAVASVTRVLKTGAMLTARLGLDLVKLLTLDRSSSFGVFADGSITLPLLRGAGRHVVIEPLTQAERDALYAVWDFERFKRTFAVLLAADYLAVLQQHDQVRNAEENYRGLIASARRARRLADAGRLPEIQVDQAVQDELRARDRWVAARQDYLGRLDAFKVSLGLPADARIVLDRAELDRLGDRAGLEGEGEGAPAAERIVPPADAPIVLEESGPEGASPYELPEPVALALALEHRLDLEVARGRVTDAQRRVTVAADALEAELNLTGSGTLGERRTLLSAGLPDARLLTEDVRYAALLRLDLPLERTAERNVFRNSYIALERAVRDYQEQEDRVKLDVRDRLRELLEAREGVRTQTMAVAVARRRVESTELFLRAGRAQIRDLLEAQEDLLTASNALSAARVNYRVAELGLQRDMGVLQVDEKGLWTEYLEATTGDDGT